MTALTQGLSDIKTIVSTDRRIWAAAGFLALVTTVWVVTGAWREDEPPPPEEYVRIKVEDDKIRNLIGEFNKDLKDGAEERKFLRESILRMAEEVQNGTEEVDWHVNVLVNKLNDMYERVDGIANKVGSSTVNRAQFEEKLKKQKQDSRKKKPVDRSLL